jgi:hypothetical protein
MTVKRFSIGLAAALLALPATAQAKGELTALRVCGQSTCAAVTDARALRGFGEAMFMDRDASLLAPAMRPYHLLRWTMAPGEGGTSYLVDGMTIVDGIWVRLPAAARGPVLRAAQRVEGIPPRIERVALDGRGSADPAAYARVFGGLRRATDVPYQAYSRRWVEIDIETTRPTPWTDGDHRVVYEPRSGLFMLPDGHWYSDPTGRLNDRVQADAGVRTAASSSGGGMHPAAYALVAVPLVALVAVYRRRRRT